MKKLYLLIPFILFFIGTVAQTPEMKKEDIRELKQKIHKQANDQKLLEKGRDEKQNIGKTISKEWEHGDAPAWVWSEDYGGSGWDNGNDVVVDASGNSYVAGSFSGEISYGDSSYTASGLRDGFVAKFDNAGNLIWFSQIEANTHGRVELKGVHVDLDGNVYTTGYFSESINPGGTLLTGDNRQNFLLLKLNSNGDVVLAKTHDTGNANVWAKAVLTDSDDNIYALASHYILKYDASGNLLFEIQEEETFNDFKLIENSLYYVGYVYSQTGNIGSASYSMDGDQDSDMFLAKSDKQGNFYFVKLPKHTNQSNDSRAFEISTDQNKNLYISGICDDLVLGEDTLSEYYENAFLAKIDTSGNAKWATHLTFHADNSFPLTTREDSITYITSGGSAYKYDSEGNVQISSKLINSTPNALSIDEYNGMVTAGNKDGVPYFSILNWSLDETVTMEFSGNSAKTQIAGLVSDGQANFYVLGTCSDTINYHVETLSEGVFFAKHGEDGSLSWVKNIPNAETRSDIGDAITIDPQNQNIFITGDFYEEINIPGGGTLTPDSDGSMFVLKYDIGGNFVWSNKIDDLSFNDADLTADYAGNVILSNPFSSTIEIGGETYTSQGDDDIITVKFDPDGNISWAVQAGGEYVEYMGITSVDENDNIYFTGEFISQNVSVGDSSLTLNEGDGNILFAKMNAEGVVQWTTSHAGSVSENSSQDSYCWPTGINTMPNGYSYIKGWHGDSVAFSDTVLTNDYWYFSKFIGKFDPEGEAVWVNSIDDENWGFDYNQMDVDDEGNVYFGAYVRDTIHFKYYEEEYTYAPVGNRDLFVAQYTSDGDIGWIKTMGSRYGYNWLSSVAVSDKNNIYAAGSYDDYISFGDTEHYSESTHGFVTKMAGNQAPTNITISSDTIEEAAPVGAEVGIFSTEDPDAGDEHTYALVSGDGTNDADNDKFDISGDTLITAAEFDYDSQQELYIYVQTEDTSGNTYEKDFVIQVKEYVNQEPTNIVLSSDSIEETAPVGATVGVFSTEDPDAGDEHTYSLVSGDGTNDADNNKFDISGDTLITAAEFDYDSQQELNIYIQTTDTAGNTYSKDFVIHVIESDNQAPTNIILSSDSIDETAPVGTAVGSFSTEDPDAGDEHTYSLVSGDGTNDADNDKFDISGSNLVTAAEFDFDSQNELNINVQTEDPAGNTFEKDFVIHVIEDESEEGDDEDEETAVRNIENSPFRVYPNPASDKLFVINSKNNGEGVNSIRIISSEGRTVYNKNLEDSRQSRINIAHIPAGIYVVEIQTEVGSYRGKLIKE